VPANLPQGLKPAFSAGLKACATHVQMLARRILLRCGMRVRLYAGGGAHPRLW